MNTKRGKKASAGRRGGNRRWYGEEEFDEEQLYIRSLELTEDLVDNDPILEEVFAQDGRGSTDFVEDNDTGNGFRGFAYGIGPAGVSEATLAESKGQRA